LWAGGVENGNKMEDLGIRQLINEDASGETERDRGKERESNQWKKENRGEN
jgi:hypothetical protein